MNWPEQERSPEAKEKAPAGHPFWLAAAQSKRILVFDLDGTLLNTMQIYAEIAAGLLSEHCSLLPQVARSRYIETSGRPFSQQLELICPRHPAQRQIVASFERRKVRAARNVVLTPRTHEVLSLLREEGWHLAVSSNNSQRNVEAFASRTPALFDVALGRSRVLCKGSSHFAALTRYFDCFLREMLFIGDSLYDGHIATASDVPFLGVSATVPRAVFEQAGYEVTTSLHEALERLRTSATFMTGLV